jgi:hypothetical protein
MLLLTAAALLPVGQAHAFLNFWKIFDEEYLTNHENEEWVASVKDPKARVNCYICHQGKYRKNHNVFGQPLTEVLGKDDNRLLLGKRRDPEAYEETRKKVIEEIKKVCAMPVNPDEPDGETYGDRIKAGKWPGGELEELKKEPPKEEEAAEVADQDAGVGE